MGKNAPSLEGDFVESWVMLPCGCLKQETMQDTLWGHLGPQIRRGMEFLNGTNQYMKFLVNPIILTPCSVVLKFNGVNMYGFVLF